MMSMDAMVSMLWCSRVPVEFPNIQPAAGDERHNALTLLQTSEVSATEHAS